MTSKTIQATQMSGLNCNIHQDNIEFTRCGGDKPFYSFLTVLYFCDNRPPFFFGKQIFCKFPYSVRIFDQQNMCSGDGKVVWQCRETHKK